MPLTQSLAPGPSAVGAAVADALDIRVDATWALDSAALADLVDAVGGVVVDVDVDVTQGRDAGAAVLVGAGPRQRLSGTEAAAYAQLVVGDEPEASRLARQKVVLGAVLGRLPADATQRRALIAGLPGAPEGPALAAVVATTGGLRAEAAANQLASTLLPVDDIDSGGDVTSYGLDAAAAAVMVRARLAGASLPVPSGGMAAPTTRPQPPLTNPPTLRPFAHDSTKQVTGTSHLTGMPRLVGVSRIPPPPASVAAPEDDDDCVALTAAPPPPVGVRLSEVLPVFAISRLQGRPAAAPAVTAEELAQAVLAAAGFDPAVHVTPDAILRDAAGAWTCRFPSAIDPRLAVAKMSLIREEFGIAAEVLDERHVVFRELAPAAGLFGFGKKTPSGFEVGIHFPEPGGRRPDIQITGSLFGKPPAEFVRAAEKAIVRMMEAIRVQLDTVRERRQHARVAAEFPLALYPLHSDGRVDAPVAGTSVNVSAGGLALRTPHFPPCKYLYVAFETVRGIEGVAALVETVRRKELPDGLLITGCYRSDS